MPSAESPAPLPPSEAAPGPTAEVSTPPVATPPPPARPALRSEPLQQAIAHVNQIITDLREALEDLEDVVGLLEVAGSQKQDDEREIEHLRRLLNQLQRVREHLPQKAERGRPPHRPPPPAPPPPPSPADEPA